MDEYIIKVNDQEILRLLDAYEPNKRDIVANKALRIGLIALKDMESAGNVDYVEKEFEKFKTNLNKEIESIKEDFTKRLSEADKVIEERFKSHFDPDNGVMSRVLSKYLGEGGSLSDLFDENNNSSAVSKIKKIMSDYFDEDSSKIVKLLDVNNEQSPLHSFKKELIDHLITIQTGIKTNEAVKAAVKAESEKGTQKGGIYQDIAFAEIEKISSLIGDTCIPTFNDEGLIRNCKTGDVVVTLNPRDTGGADLKIVFEAKDRMVSLRGIHEELDEAMKNRKAGVSVAVLSSQYIIKDVNANIGLLRDYNPNKTLCILDKEEIDRCALEISYKLARAKLLLGLKAKEMKGDAIDLVAINQITDEVLKKIADLSTIKGVLTKANGAIGEAQSQIDNLRAELTDKLEELSIRLKPAPK